MLHVDFTRLKPANYNRKSSDSEDKQMLSIISQLDEAQRIAQFYNLPTFVEVFEEAKSAKMEFVRPEFSRMMRMIEEGKVDSIVCWKLDRLARNMTEGGKIIDLLSSGKLKAIITHDKVFYPWDNVIVMSVEFSQGKQFVKDLSVNVKRGQTKKASMGIPHGVATLGFLNDKTEEKGNRKWLVDEVRIKSIKVLLDLFLTGTYSAGKLHKYAVNVLKLTTVKRKHIGGEYITVSRIYEILKDPIYAGFFYYGGERYELSQALPRLITEGQHRRIKELLARNNIPKVKHHETTYSGFIVSNEGNFIGQDVKSQVICDCKHKFAYQSRTHCPQCNTEIENMLNPKYLLYCWFYNVSKKKKGIPYKSISQDKIDKEVAKLFVENLAFSSDLVEWSKKYIHEMKERDINQKILSNQSKEARKVDYEDKKTKLRRLLRDEYITKSEYDSDIKGLEAEYADLQQESKQIDWYSRLMNITDITGRVATVFESDNVQAKRNILSELGSNLIWDDENLLIINKKEVEKLIQAVKGIKSTFPKFEPRNYVANKELNEKTSEFSPVFSTLLRE